MSSTEGFYIRKEMAYAKLADLKQKAPDKLEAILAKAEEKRLRTEATRHAASLESRERSMMNRTMMGSGFPERIQRSDYPALKPLVQEVVAEFLKEKRLEAASKPEEVAPKPSEPSSKPKPGKE